MVNVSKSYIKFQEDDACHIYEYLRFYWEDYFLRNPGDRKGMDKFGNCVQCRVIGKRLEKFIGARHVKHVNKSIKEHRRNHERKQSISDKKTRRKLDRF